MDRHIRRSGGLMNREKWYLVISLAIIIISGVIIYQVQSSRPLSHDHPPISEARSQVSVTLIKQIAQLKKQLESDPENYGVLVGLGNNYYDLNNPEESVKYYEMALKLRPDVPEVMVDCGTMYRKLGETDKSLEMFTRAAELAPDLPQASYNLGAVIYSEKNDPAGAAKIWQRYLNNNPEIDQELKNFFQDKIDQALGVNQQP
jgi:tetratricopeptide (TPR) repeat protein